MCFMLSGILQRRIVLDESPTLSNQPHYITFAFMQKLMEDGAIALNGERATDFSVLLSYLNHVLITVQPEPRDVSIFFGLRQDQM